MTTKAKQPLISIIIPVYNVADYLDRCIKSVVESDYHNLQIICINDGSTDESGNKLETWRRKDSRIQVITTENQGLSEARNTGIREAKGEYITFIDSDDWVHPRYFSILLGGIMIYDADICVCGEMRVSNDKEVKESAESNIEWSKMDIGLFSRLHNRGFVWGKLYKRELAQPIFDRAMLRCEDIAYNMRLVFFHPNLVVAVTKEPLYYYSYRSGSLTDTSTGEQYKLLFEYFLRFAEESIEDENDILQGIFVIETVKRALIYRYLSMYIPTRDKEAKSLCRKGKNLLWISKGISILNKMVYTVFLFFPLTYRVFRIVDDPTMLNWERNQRKIKRQKKTHD